MKWPPATITLDLDRATAFVRVKVLERRFRKRDVGSVTIDLSTYTVADRCGGDKGGEAGGR